MNFYKHWIGDYARDTGDLTLLEHGAYRLLLDAYYAADGLLPEDYARLYRIARAYEPAEQLAVRTVADRFFPVDAGAYAGLMRRNKRADQEIAEARKFTSAQSKRARSRWRDKVPENDAGADARASENAGAMPGQCPDDASHSHSHSHSSYNYNNNDDERGARALHFADLDQQAAYLGHRRASRNPTAFDATLRAILTGQTTGKPVEEPALGMALLEMSANGEPFNANRLRGYLRKHEAGHDVVPRAGQPLAAGGRRWTLTDAERAQVIAELDAEDRQAQLARGVA